MTIQTIGVIVFLIWITYVLVVPAQKVNLKLVVVLIGISMFCIGGIALFVMYFTVIGAVYVLTKL